MGQTNSNQRLSPWMDIARKEQQLFLRDFRCRRTLSFEEEIPSICICNKHEDKLYATSAKMNALKKLIGTLLFDEPKVRPSGENDFTGFNAEEMKYIEQVFWCLTTKRCPSGNGFEITIIMISLKIGGTNENPTVVHIPLFRVHVAGINEGTDYNFVDLFGRWYEDWNDFVSNNKLPASEYCFPKDGVYSEDANGNVELVFGCTPAAKLGRHILHGTDIAGSVVGAGAAIGLIFPPALIACGVISGACCIHGIVRASVRLADRGKHKQSIADVGAGLQWASLASCTLGLACSGVLAAARLVTAEGKLILTLAPGLVDGLKSVTTALNTGEFLAKMSKVSEGTIFHLDPLLVFEITAAGMLVGLTGGAGSAVLLEMLTKAAGAYPCDVGPKILAKIKCSLKNKYPSLDTMLKDFENKCGGGEFLEYGPKLYAVIWVIFKMYKITELVKAEQYVNILVLVLNKAFSHISSKYKTATEPEIMGKILNNPNFIPQLLTFFKSDETYFYFPRKYCWGSDGVLSSSDREKIVKKFLESKYHRTHFDLEISSAHPNHFHEKRFGLTITESLVEQKVIRLRQFEHMRISPDKLQIKKSLSSHLA